MKHHIAGLATYGKIVWHEHSLQRQEYTFATQEINICVGAESSPDTN
jgi:hypothetical protein